MKRIPWLSSSLVYQPARNNQCIEMTHNCVCRNKWQQDAALLILPNNVKHKKALKFFLTLTSFDGTRDELPMLYTMNIFIKAPCLLPSTKFSCQAIFLTKYFKAIICLVNQMLYYSVYKRQNVAKSCKRYLFRVI